MYWTLELASHLTDAPWPSSKDELIDTQVIVVVKFPPKKIGSFISECLITGFYRSDNKVVLAKPNESIPNGARLE